MLNKSVAVPIVVACGAGVLEAVAANWPSEFGHYGLVILIRLVGFVLLLLAAPLFFKRYRRQ